MSAADLRVLPQAIEAERAVLGGLLLLATDPERVRELCGLLTPQHFYNNEHGRLFALLANAARTAPMDIIGLTEHLFSTKGAEKLGGLAYVARLPEQVPTTANLDYYVNLIRDRASRRALLAHLLDVRERVLGGAEDLPGLLAHAQTGLGSIQANMAGEDLDTVQIDAAVEAWERDFDEEQEAVRTNRLVGIPRAFPMMDFVFGRMHPGFVEVYAARPAMGKSAILFKQLLKAAQWGRDNYTGGVVLLSLEMSRKQVIDRWVADITGLPYSGLREALSDGDRLRVRDALAMLHSLPIVINDRAGLSLRRMRRVVATAKKRFGGLVAVGVDYLQLATVDDEAQRQPDRRVEVDQVSRGLKALAKDFEVPVMVLAQLNRALESRAEKRPMASDLRESGQIEQDADRIFGLFRAAVYDPSAAQNVLEVICLKNRHGKQGTVELGWKAGSVTDAPARETQGSYGFRPSQEERETDTGYV